MREETNKVGLHPVGLDAAFVGDRDSMPGLMFYKLFGEVPSRKYYEGLNKKLFLERITKEFNLESKQITKAEHEEDGKMQLRSFLAEVGDGCLLYVPMYSYSGEGDTLKLYYSSKTSLKSLKKIEQLAIDSKEEKYKNNLYLLSNEDYGLTFKSFEMEDRELDLKTHYNDDFKEIDQLIKSKLNKSGEKGIVLLHGEPGTGKTSYIRHLIGEIDKKMIYIPSDMSESLADPKFIQLLSANKDSVIIIEDAESVLVDRGTTKNSAISNLLNIADGLLSDCLNIQLICTFNVHISRIDNALLRKGRIIASYEMKKLSVEKTVNLLKDKYDSYEYESLNLAQIYNYEERDFDREEKKIGFGAEV